jgi:hypothetical protein
MNGIRRGLVGGWIGVLLLSAAVAQAQVQTGSITGIVSDTSGAVLPGVTVSLSGEKLIGGTQTQVTDAGGNYRFDRLPPGDYTVKFELQGRTGGAARTCSRPACSSPASTSRIATRSRATCI